MGEPDGLLRPAEIDDILTPAALVDDRGFVRLFMPGVSSRHHGEALHHAHACG